MYAYPIRLDFRILALAPQIRALDAQGYLVGYVHQKLFKLREQVTVFADEAKSRPLYFLEADRIIDWSAQYAIRRADGTPVGIVQRQGMKSLWRAEYHFVGPEGPDATIRENSGWVKVFDHLLGEIPVVGLLTGLVFNPTYDVTRKDGTPMVRIVKKRSLLESRFTLEALGPMDDAEEELVLLATVMMVLLERSRG